KGKQSRRQSTKVPRSATKRPGSKLLTSPLRKRVKIGSSNDNSSEDENEKRAQLKTRQRSKRAQEEEEEEEDEGENADEQEESDDHNDNVSDAEPESSSSDEDSDGVDEYVDRSTAKGRRGRGRGRGGVSGVASTRGGRRGGRASKTAGVAEVSTSPNMQSGCDLFDAIVDNQTSLKQQATDWISSYRESPCDAICELVNLAFKAAGCPGAILSQAIQDEDGSVKDTVDELFSQCKSLLKRGRNASTVDTLNQGLGADYPLANKAKTFKKFQKNVLEFITQIMTSGQHRLVFGESESSEFCSPEGSLSYFITIFTSWIFEMANSTYRPFRHVATVFGLHLLSSLVSIRVRLEADIVTAQRQLTSLRNKSSATSGRSRRKSSGSTTNPHLERAEQHANEVRLQRSATIQALSHMFDGLFKLRVRDIDPHLRIECINHLSQWISQDPNAYLESRYTRYFGWGWNDKDAKVREAALVGVSNVYKSGGSTIATGLRSFMQRFGSRLVQIAVSDTDHKTQIAALNLLNIMKDDGLLSSDSILTWGKLHGGAGEDGVDDSDSKGNKSQSQRGRKGKGKKGKSSTGWSLSQDMLQSDSDSDNDTNKSSSKDGPIVFGAEVLSMASFTSTTDRDEDLFPSHPIMNYVAPLLLHTNVHVRNAATPLVQWWIKSEWIPFIGTRVSETIGFDEGDEDSDAEDGLTNDTNNQDDQPSSESTIDNTINISFDLISRNISELHSSNPSLRKNNLKVWLNFKAISAFLKHLGTLSNSKNDNSDETTNALKAIETKDSILKRALDEETNWSMLEDFASFSATGSSLNEKLNTSRLKAGASALWHEFNKFQNIINLADYICLDHSESTQQSQDNQARNDIFPDGRYKLTQEEEIAILYAFSSWISEYEGSLTLKLAKEKRKDGRKSLESQLEGPSRILVNRLDGLLRRYSGNPQAIVPLLDIMSNSLRWQVFFDMKQIPTLQKVAEMLLSLLNRHIDSFYIVASCVHILGVIDDLGLLKYGSNNLNFDSNLDQLDFEDYELKDIIVPAVADGDEDQESDVGMYDSPSEEEEQSDQDENNRDTDPQGADKSEKELQRKIRRRRLGNEDPTIPGPLIKLATAQAIRMLLQSIGKLVEGTDIAERLPQDPLQLISLPSDELIQDIQSAKFSSIRNDELYQSLTLLRMLIREKNIVNYLSIIPKSSHGDDTYGEQNRSRGTIQWIDMFFARPSIVFGDNELFTTLSALDIYYRFVLWSSYNLNSAISKYTESVLSASSHDLGADDSNAPPEGAQQGDKSKNPGLDSDWREIVSLTERLKADRDRLHDSCALILSNLDSGVDAASYEPTSAMFLHERVLCILAQVYQLFTGDLVRRPAQIDSSNDPSENSRLEAVLQLRKKLTLLAPQNVYQNLSKCITETQKCWIHRLENVHNDLTREGLDILPADLFAILEPHYKHVLDCTAAWAQLLLASIIPVSYVSLIGRYLGRSGLENSIKNWEKELRSNKAKKSTEKSRKAPKAGFVSLTAYDHLIQSTVEGLKLRLTIQATRENTLDSFFNTMKSIFEESTGLKTKDDTESEQPSTDSCLESQEEPTRHVVTFSRMFSSAARTAFPQPVSSAVNKAGLRSAASTLAPPLIGQLMVKIHKECITYILDLVNDNMPTSEGKGEDQEVLKKQEYLWADVVNLWFTALSQMVVGIMRPRHAELVNTFLHEELEKRNLKSKIREDSGNEEETADQEEKTSVAILAEQAVLPYQRSLDRELSKLSAIRERVAATSVISPMSGGPPETQNPDTTKMLEDSPAPETPSRPDKTNHENNEMEIE
ncbi:cohesin complex subunit, partial [Mycoemilia scoparia]